MNTPKLVIVGGGFAGLSLARDLKHVPLEITLIDRCNYHLFQPLLYQVATAGLSPAEIASPIRHILKSNQNTDVMMAEVTGVDAVRKKVLCGAREVDYDFLVLATGARHSYFGHEEWEMFATGLKTIEEATRIRNKILYAFEQAEVEPSLEMRRKLLTFVIVGGGPTGVELAGAIAELSKVALVRDFHHIDPRTARVVLIEAGSRLLTSFPESLSQKAANDLQHLGVEIQLNCRVSMVDESGVLANNEKILTQNVIWAAGVKASPVAQWLGLPADRNGRVEVRADLSLQRWPEVFVLGDAADFKNEKGESLPGVAPVAMQQGHFLAKLLKKKLKGEDVSALSFRYINKGNLATIGRSKAVADLGKIQLSGLVAWVAWLFVHILYLIGFRNRAVVLLSWTWAYLTFQTSARLITTPQRDTKT